MAYSTSLRTDSHKFELSTGDSFSPSPEINYICIPTAEGVKISIISALERLELPQGRSFLVQFWAAIKIGNTCVLTTTCQPYGVCGINQELESYRIACSDHKLYVHPEKRVAFGLPGRVFLNLIPEVTQNVHDYPEEQRPPCQDDIFSKIWGSFAMPVIDPANNSCVGVLEFVTDPPQDSYANDIYEVYKVLKCAGLESSIQIHSPSKVTASPVPWRCIRRSYSFEMTKYSCLVPFFGLSSAEAAKRLNVPQCTFRNIRNRVGIPEWPWMPNYNQTTTAFSALETEINPTKYGIPAGTTYDPTLTAIDDIPLRPWGHFGNHDLPFENIEYLALPDGINQLASDNPNYLEPFIDSEDHDQDMSINGFFDFESWK